MKELSIEEKAKAYDEAIEKLRGFYRDYNTVSCLIDVKEELANLFHELKESEDSRIRNVIRGWICTQPGSFFDNGISKEQMLAWLEKQGESDFEQCAREGDKIVTNEDGTRFNISQFERVTEKVAESKETAKEFLKSAEIMNGNNELADEYRPERQGGQKPTDKVKPKFHEGEWITNGEDALWAMKQAASIAKDENDMGNIWNAETWLESLKERMKGE